MLWQLKPSAAREWGVGCHYWSTSEVDQIANGRQITTCGAPALAESTADPPAQPCSSLELRVPLEGGRAHTFKGNRVS